MHHRGSPSPGPRESGLVQRQGFAPLMGQAAVAQRGIAGVAQRLVRPAPCPRIAEESFRHRHPFAGLSPLALVSGGSPLPMPRTPSVALDQVAAVDRISFLKAITDGRHRRGSATPSGSSCLWWCSGSSAVAAMPGISGAFARRHREALKRALGLDFKRSPQMPPTSTPCASRKPGGYSKAHLKEFG
jgi:hypothetical protein